MRWPAWYWLARRTCPSRSNTQRLLGALALTEGAYAECRRRAQASLAVAERTGQGIDAGLAHIVLAHAAHGLGDLDGARRHLSAALPRMRASGANLEFLWVRSAAALVLADRGKTERAIEALNALKTQVFQHTSMSLAWEPHLLSKH